MLKEIALQIVLENPVDGIAYGLQKGKGPHYEIVQSQIGTGNNLIFEFIVQLKQASGSVLSPGGPFVQGTFDNRFVYIDIGSYAGQAGAQWSGRLKVPLPEATFQNLVLEDDSSFRYCTVPGRTLDGKPMFATVKPFGGWLERKLSV
jgi:hypothetical protein